MPPLLGTERLGSRRRLVVVLIPAMRPVANGALEGDRHRCRLLCPLSERQGRATSPALGAIAPQRVLRHAEKGRSTGGRILRRSKP
jgi:hypothetical protein